MTEQRPTYHADIAGLATGRRRRAEYTLSKIRRQPAQNKR